MQLGCFPEIDGVIDFLPVDVAAQLMVTLGVKADFQRTGGGVFHIANPLTASCAVLSEAMRNVNASTKSVSLQHWRQKVAQLRVEDNNAMYPLVPSLMESGPIFRQSRLSTKNTEESVGTLLMSCPDSSQLAKQVVSEFMDDALLQF